MPKLIWCFLLALPLTPRASAMVEVGRVGADVFLFSHDSQVGLDQCRQLGKQWQLTPACRPVLASKGEHQPVALASSGTVRDRLDNITSRPKYWVTKVSDAMPQTVVRRLNQERPWNNMCYSSALVHAGVLGGSDYGIFTHPTEHIGLNELKFSRRGDELFVEWARPSHNIIHNRTRFYLGEMDTESIKAILARSAGTRAMVCFEPGKPRHSRQMLDEIRHEGLEVHTDPSFKHGPVDTVGAHCAVLPSSELFLDANAETPLELRSFDAYLSTFDRDTTAYVYEFDSKAADQFQADFKAGKIVSAENTKFIQEFAATYEGVASKAKCRLFDELACSDPNLPLLKAQLARKLTPLLWKLEVRHDYINKAKKLENASSIEEQLVLWSDSDKDFFLWGSLRNWMQSFIKMTSLEGEYPASLRVFGNQPDYSDLYFSLSFDEYLESQSEIDVLVENGKIKSMTKKQADFLPLEVGSKAQELGDRLFSSYVEAMKRKGVAIRAPKPRFAVLNIDQKNAFPGKTEVAINGGCYDIAAGLHIEGFDPRPRAFDLSQPIPGTISMQISTTNYPMFLATQDVQARRIIERFQEVSPLKIEESDRGFEISDGRSAAKVGQLRMVLPTNWIVITKGLLESSSKAEMATVIAHEMGHYLAHAFTGMDWTFYDLKSLKSSYSFPQPTAEAESYNSELDILFQLEDHEHAKVLAAELESRLHNKGVGIYNLEQEADLLSVEILSSAGISPYTAVRFMDPSYDLFSGEPVPMGNLFDIHHSNQHRSFVMSQWIKASYVTRRTQTLSHL